jgi:hypothetical protein
VNCPRPTPHGRTVCWPSSWPTTGSPRPRSGAILADLDLKPHRVRGWLTRRASPDFFVRAAAVCDLYLNPPAGSIVVCIDEKTAIGARSRKHPDQPARPGRVARREFEYVRHGTVSMIAALHVHTGQVITEQITRNDSIAELSGPTRTQPGAVRVPRSRGTGVHQQALTNAEQP